MKKVSLLLLGAFTFFGMNAQVKDTLKPKPAQDTAKVKKPEPAAAKEKEKPKKEEKIKPYKDIITDKAVTNSGVFKIHKVEDKYYFEIPDEVLKKEFLIVNRITKAAAGMRQGNYGYAGDQISQNVVAFDKGPNDKIFLRAISYVDYPKDSTSEMYQTVVRNNVQAIVQSFEIKAFGEGKKSSVIDVTAFINSDNEYISFAGPYRKSFGVGGFQGDKSYINFTKAFPANVEINATKTYGKDAGRAGASNYTIEVNSSWVLLPENKMQARYYDPRVGYFVVGYTDFDLNPQGIKKAWLIKRWRLEPKPQDLEKYKKGQLVEPAKPIVFYIDPATPKKWVPYLMQGVNDWQKAFEKAGFKNAIYAKIPNKKDEPDWSLEDARYSAIVYKPSDVPNASGPSIADPRTGEILESHINWYHNIMSLLRDWYFIQASPSDPRARKMQFDDKLMGELIRFVAAHEVGHALGLRHNFGSSSTVPVEKLRDKKWVEQHGHTPSIMDYARFNYVAQPEDKIGEKGMMPRIGDYDEWAIEWGYKRFYQYKNEEQEKPFINKWTMDRLKNPRLWFGTETNPYDPRSQSEQIGDNPMLAGKYGVKNLQFITKNLPEWTKTANEGYENLDIMYGHVVSQFSRYLGHTATYIGGVYETPKYTEEQGGIYAVVPKAEQKEALKFLNDYAFQTPTWLLSQEVFEKTQRKPTQVVESLQNRVLDRILSGGVLNSLYTSQATYKDAYPLDEYMKDLRNYIFSSANPDIYQRNLQRNYVKRMVALFTGTGQNNSDLSAIALGTLNEVAALCDAKKNQASEPANRYHFEELKHRVEKALNIKN